MQTDWFRPSSVEQITAGANQVWNGLLNVNDGSLATYASNRITANNIVGNKLRLNIDLLAQGVPADSTGIFVEFRLVNKVEAFLSSAFIGYSNESVRLFSGASTPASDELRFEGSNFAWPTTPVTDVYTTGVLDDALAFNNFNLQIQLRSGSNPFSNSEARIPEVEFRVSYTPPPPVAATLIAPENLTSPAVLERRDPLFEWTDGAGSVATRLETSYESDFSVLDYTATTGSPHRPPANTFDAGSIVYWRVIAIGIDDTEVGSEERSFEVGDIPGSFTLTSPADNAYDAGTGTDFDWSDAANADRYVLEVNDQEDFSGSSIPTDGVVGSAQAFPDGTFTANRYWWRVRAINDFGERVSTARTFSPFPDGAVIDSVVINPDGYSVTVTVIGAVGEVAQNVGIIIGISRPGHPDRTVFINDKVSTTIEIGGDDHEQATFRLEHGVAGFPVYADETVTPAGTSVEAGFAIGVDMTESPAYTDDAINLSELQRPEEPETPSGITSGGLLSSRPGYR